MSSFDDWSANGQQNVQQAADPWALSAQLGQAQPWMQQPPGISGVGQWEGYASTAPAPTTANWSGWNANVQAQAPQQPVPGGVHSVTPTMRTFSSLGKKIAKPVEVARNVNRFQDLSDDAEAV